jgi:Fe-Mn family superoxide dismutase
MNFTLPKLKYAYDALEPFIDGKTMEVHHSKHHQTYTDNFNKALEGQKQLEGKSAEWILANLDSIPEAVRTAMKNNGGGFYNHSLFFSILSGNKNEREFKGKIAEAIIRDFGSYDRFKELLSDCAMKRFGSGWAWLVLNKGNLEIYSTANQDCPLSEGKIPLMCIDVWEHGYYLKFMNKRKDYVDVIWNVFNWENINELYQKALDS